MRRPRDDYPGADWLITNRGLAKRAVFETRQDVERFTDAIARVVELGLIEVDAYVFMTTHFHLQLRSVTGEISRAMKLITNEFVRWFNRARRRDGPLFAGRFDGRRLDDGAYWQAVLRYIDLNPVRGKLCAIPSDHPYGSARAYRYGEQPSWLYVDRVLATLEGFCAPRRFAPTDYDRYACVVDADANAYLVERLLRDPDRAAPPLSDLIRTASLRQQGWMEWKAALADGMQVGTAFLPPEYALCAARLAARCLQQAELPATRRTLERDLSVGLLRFAAGCTMGEIATRLGVARSTAIGALRRYEQRSESSSRTRDVIALVLQRSVRRVLPLPQSPLALPLHVGR